MKRWLWPLLGAVGLGAWMALGGDDDVDEIHPVDGVIFSWFREPGRPNHKGVDIAAPEGAPVRAVWPGTVQFVQTPEKWATRDPGPGRDAGAYIEISHALADLPAETVARIGKLDPVYPGGPGPAEFVVTRYMHLRTTDVAHKQTVRAGDVIGTLGRTGVETSRTHLHFEVRLQRPPERYGDALDPVAVGIVS